MFAVKKIDDDSWKDMIRRRALTVKNRYKLDRNISFWD